VGPVQQELASKARRLGRLTGRRHVWASPAALLRHHIHHRRWDERRSGDRAFGSLTTSASTSVPDRTALPEIDHSRR
jgi:hypothetical protein